MSTPRPCFSDRTARNEHASCYDTDHAANLAWDARDELAAIELQAEGHTNTPSGFYAEIGPRWRDAGPTYVKPAMDASMLSTC